MSNSLKAVLAAALLGSLALALTQDPAPMAGKAKMEPACELRMALRKLWEEHLVYTRNYVISSLAGLPDADAVAQRLLRNQDDIGAAIRPYYGEPAARQLAALLREHIRIAGEVIMAAKAGQADDLALEQEKWSMNGKDIAAFLAAANPHWSRKTMEEMLQKHLDLTTGEVVGRLTKDWAADIKAYDDGHEHMLMFADLLADGLKRQFPARF